MNWNRNTSSRFEARFAGICSNENDTQSSSGGDSGGGGGGPAPVESNPGGNLGASGGGAVEQPADHSKLSPPPSTPDHAGRVVDILKKGRQKDHILSIDEIADLISFDTPFTKPAAPAKPAATPAPATPQTPAQPETPATAQPQLSPEVQAIVAALQQALPQQPQVPAQPQPTSPPPAPKPYYGGEVPALQVSPELLKGLLGTEDPAVLAQAAPAVNALANGIMNRVMEDATTRMAAIANAVMRQVPQHVQQVQQTSQVEQKFYSVFPELQRPAFKTTVDAISNLYFQAQRKTNPNFAWTPEHLAKVGELAHAKLEQELGMKIPRAVASIGNAPQPPKPGTPPAAQPKAAQPYIARGSARPSAAGPADSQSADLLSFVI